MTDWDTINDKKQTDITIGQAYNLAAEDLKGSSDITKEQARLLQRALFHYESIVKFRKSIWNMIERQEAKPKQFDLSGIKLNIGNNDEPEEDYEIEEFDGDE